MRDIAVEHVRPRQRSHVRDLHNNLATRSEMAPYQAQQIDPRFTVQMLEQVKQQHPVVLLLSFSQKAACLNASYVYFRGKMPARHPPRLQGPDPRLSGG